MNLAEFPLSTIGERAPAGVDRLVFEDEGIDPSTGERSARRVTVLGQAPFGLPTSVDDEVLMGCLRATKDAGFDSRRVDFEPASFLRAMRWSTDGPAYARLRRALDRYSTVSVVSEGAYWHKGKRKPVRDVVGILDRWQSSGRDRETGLPEKAFFVWGDFMWESFQAGNLRNLDYDFLLGLEHAISRRAYRFLGKRFYHNKSIRMGLKHFAVNKIGMSDKNHNGQIKATLKKAHTELERKGFCRAEYVGRGQQAEVVYHAIGAEQQQPRDPLVGELRRRGVSGAAKLVTADNRERVRQAIANYDHRRDCGEKVGPGWLHQCIVADSAYKFRDDYVSPEAVAKRRQASAASDARKAKRTERLEASEDSAMQRERKRFGAFIQSLDEEAYEQFREQAIAASSAYGKSLRTAKPETMPHYATYLEAALLGHWRRTVCQRD
ncbi:Replication initiator protein A [Posidoniimonas corsicana]|uniref:Replication initiator protein A n=1 Tax=Posidoniimonas corsicana TaxID=1938618 RepID=A0A5C5VHL4_9BACT|nr:replication initiator protein A [Posidoniimonas corsicana]TWT37172.1 Replication initiator protein A [Posidoniimonas corsicana]